MIDPYFSGRRSEDRSAAIYAITNEERSVLALERIADEFTLLNQALEQLLDRGQKQPLGDGSGSSDPLEPKNGLEESSHATPANITADDHSRADPFTVAGHRYTDLSAAIEEARREREAVPDV